MAVGNVGEELAGYTSVPLRLLRLPKFTDSCAAQDSDSDTFLTRDAGLTWEEVHKDAHLWEFGDYGSIIVIVKCVSLTVRGTRRKRVSLI